MDISQIIGQPGNNLNMDSVLSLLKNLAMNNPMLQEQLAKMQTMPAAQEVSVPVLSPPMLDVSQGKIPVQSPEKHQEIVAEEPDENAQPPMLSIPAPIEEEEETITTLTLPQVSPPSLEEEKVDSTEKTNSCLLSIQRTENNDDTKIRCEICLDEECYPDDELVICEFCLSAVHQSWYGRDIMTSVPESDWFCERCTFLKNNGKTTGRAVEEIKCQLCFDPKGIIIHTDELQWVHPTCVNWIPDVYFDDDSNLTKILGEISKERYKVRWRFCNRRKGAWVQWDYKSCTCNFHVSWGVKKGLIKVWTEMDEYRDPEYPEAILLFCQKHQAIAKKEIKSNGFQSVLVVQETKKRKREEGKVDKSKKKVKKTEDDYEDEEDKKDVNYIVEKGTRKSNLSKTRHQKNSKATKSIQQDNQNIQNGIDPRIYEELKKLNMNMASSNQISANKAISNPFNDQFQLITALGQIIGNKPKAQLPIRQPETDTKKQTGNSKKTNLKKGPTLKPKANQNNTTKKVVKSADNNKDYIVDSRLAKIIGLNRGKIKDITNHFITYALKNKLVDKKTHNYLIFKDFWLKSVLGIDQISSVELSMKLLPFLTEEIKLFQNQQEQRSNEESKTQNVTMRKTRNSTLLKKIQGEVIDTADQEVNKETEVKDNEDSEEPLTFSIRKNPDNQISQASQMQAQNTLQTSQPNGVHNQLPKSLDFSKLTKDQLIALLQNMNN